MSASTISPMTAIVEDFDPFAAIATNTKRPSLQVQNSGPVGRSSSAMVTGSTSLIPSLNPSNSRSVSIDSAPAKSIFSSIAQADRRSSHPALNSEIPNSAPPMYSVAVPPPQPTSAASAAAFVAPPHLPKPGMMLVPVSGIGPSGQPTTIMVSIPVGGSLTVHANGSTLINQPNTPPSQTRPTGPRERHNSNDSTVASPVASPTNAGQSAAAHRNANSRDIQKRNLYIATSPNLPPVHTNTDSASGLDFDAIAARPSPSSRSRHTGSDGLTVALSLPPQSPHSTNKPISPAEAAAMISPQLAELNNKPPNAAKSPVGRKNFSIAHPIGEFDSAGKGESDETVEDETKTHDETLQVPGSGRQSRRNSVDRNHRAHSMITTHSSKSPGAGHGHNHGHSHANGSGGSPAAVASGSPTPISPTSPKHSKKSSTRTTKHHKDSTTEKEEDPQAAKERIVRKIAERDKRADAWTFSKSKTSTTLGFVKNCLVWKFVLRPRTSDLPAPISSSAAASVPASTSVAIARDEEHEVELFHSIMGGKRTVKVDGAVIVQEKKLLDGGSRYTFEVGALAETRVPCILDILATGSEFQYEFTVDGIPWSESKEKFMNAMNKEYEKIYTKAQSLGIKVEPLGVAGIIDQIKTSAANGNVLANNYSGPVYGPVL